MGTARNTFLALLLCLLFSGFAFTQGGDASAATKNEAGEKLAASGQLLDAEASFGDAVALDARFGRAYLNRGMVRLQLKNRAGAASDLDQAIHLLGQSADAGYALYVRAKIYTEVNDLDKSRDALMLAVKYEPGLAEAWSDLGSVRKSLSDRQGATRAFQRAVDLKPADPIAQYRLGVALMETERVHQAIEHLKTARQNEPKDQSILNALQAALRKDGQTQEADRIRTTLAELLRDRDLSRQNAVTAIRLNNEGAALQTSGDLPQAAAKYEQAVQLYPDHVGLRVNWAVALLRLGEWTRGLDQLHQAAQMDPQNEKIQAALKDALAQAPPELVPHWAH